MARTKTELDDYMGIPMPSELKKRVKKLAEKCDPKAKPATMARSLLEYAVTQREADEQKPKHS